MNDKVTLEEMVDETIPMSSPTYGGQPSEPTLPGDSNPPPYDPETAK